MQKSRRRERVRPCSCNRNSDREKPREIKPIKTIDIDKIYREYSPDRIPWNVEDPPEILVELVRSMKVKPCRSADMGCGIGNYAIYLAGRGFAVTGIDSSPTAIGLARENAVKKGVACDFVVADVLGDLSGFAGTFSFVYDWELLHHIFPEQRLSYVENVRRILKPGGKYLSVCFSENDTGFGGTGKYRETSLGTVLYFSSEKELESLFSRFFTILELKTAEIKGRFANHLAVCAFMESN
ncbi:MAG TPA: class I SAM-dependent methyltransferase [Geobacteraceae bacterium]|nr:class I SAM-dependent methyltransferase [Geobacteraceae bacterium]